MKRIALVTGKSDYPPMGALYLANALESAGYRVTIHNSDENKGSFLASLQQTGKPLFVGFSVHTWPEIVDMVDKSKVVKEFTDIPVVWGGTHPTILPEECMAEDYIDYVVRHDGEKAIVALADALSLGKTLENPIIEGGWLSNLDEYEPAWHHITVSSYLFDHSHSVRGTNTENHRASRIFYYLMTSRGCPFGCTFCLHSRTPKAPYRAHSAEWVRKQVLFLQEENDIDGIGFWDDYFFGDMARATEIIEFLHDRKLGFLCEARADQLDKSFVAWLSKMGCLQVFVGAEAGTDRVLEAIRKKITVGSILDASKVACDYDLPIRFSFIHGFPGETVEEMFETKALINKLKECPNVSISGPKLLTPYPGTKIYEEALASGFAVPADTKEWAEINRFSKLKYLPWLAEELDAARIDLADLM